jgi:hypothetical protein
MDYDKDVPMKSEFRVLTPCQLELFEESINKIRKSFMYYALRVKNFEDFLNLMDEFYVGDPFFDDLKRENNWAKCSNCGKFDENEVKQYRCEACPERYWEYFFYCDECYTNLKCKKCGKFTCFKDFRSWRNGICNGCSEREQ